MAGKLKGRGGGRVIKYIYLSTGLKSIFQYLNFTWVLMFWKRMTFMPLHLKDKYRPFNCTTFLRRLPLLIILKSEDEFSVLFSNLIGLTLISLQEKANHSTGKLLTPTLKCSLQVLNSSVWTLRRSWWLHTMKMMTGAPMAISKSHVWDFWNEKKQKNKKIHIVLGVCSVHPTQKSALPPPKNFAVQREKARRGM